MLRNLLGKALDMCQQDDTVGYTSNSSRKRQCCCFSQIYIHTPLYPSPLKLKLALHHLPHTNTLRLPQHPNLPITRRITRHKQPTHLIPRQPRRAEASGAKTRSITLTPLYSGIKKDIPRRIRTGERFHRRKGTIRTFLKIHSHKLEPSHGLTVPTTMVGYIHSLAISVELAVDGCGVRLQSDFGGRRARDAGIVVHV